jgi:hypothetical protein
VSSCWPTPQRSSGSVSQPPSSWAAPRGEIRAGSKGRPLVELTLRAPATVERAQLGVGGLSQVRPLKHERGTFSRTTGVRGSSLEERK